MMRECVIMKILNRRKTWIHILEYVKKEFYIQKNNDVSIRVLVKPGDVWKAIGGSTYNRILRKDDIEIDIKSVIFNKIFEQIT